MEKGIVYTQDPGSADYPKGYWKGAVTVTKVRNAAKKAGFDVSCWEPDDSGDSPV